MNETIFRPVETANLLHFLRNYLRSHDPEYAEAEKSCQESILSLKSALKPDSSPLLDAYIAAEDARISTCLRILFWKGLHQNEACFRDPIQKKFLDLDFEDIFQETVLNRLPEAHQAYNCARSLHQQLAEDQLSLLEPVTEYYCHLETAGYKFAHYWGFRYGDELLPHVIPGYVSDRTLTSTYNRIVHNYLAFNPSE